jgi:hypothetical protein
MSGDRPLGIYALSVKMIRHLAEHSPNSDRIFRRTGRVTRGDGLYHSHAGAGRFVATREYVGRPPGRRTKIEWLACATAISR